ncbi:MAG: hypothetical protein JW731_11160 [Bacteroidales bacterium]|nr:hypothetical protein [Bacteroidales bacterium]
MQNNLVKTFAWLFVFSVAMGFMESAVVVYLRKIYYPGGFDFPLAPIDFNIAITEILREAATLIMLISAGIIAGRTKTEKFGFFVFCFGIWDIFYYVFLKLLIGWPVSLLTWDILFLIPTTWVGPVLGPIINSLTMIMLAVLISRFTNSGYQAKFERMEWLLLVSGSLVIISSYIEDYLQYILQHYNFGQLFHFSENEKLLDYAVHYIPVSFSWWLFVLGEAVLFVAIARFYFRNKKARGTKPNV